MQELAEAGARVLNAQAVEFAKDRGIAIYARAARGGDGETVVRRYPPRAPGRVVGVASETGLVLLRLPGGDLGGLVAVLERLDSRAAGGKQLRFDGPAGASLVLSLENLHDYGALRRDLDANLPGVSVLEGVAPSPRSGPASTRASATCARPCGSWATPARTSSASRRRASGSACSSRRPRSGRPCAGCTASSASADQRGRSAGSSAWSLSKARNASSSWS